MEPHNSILPRDMNINIKQTIMVVGTPPITISTTCCKVVASSIAFPASKSETLFP